MRGRKKPLSYSDFWTSIVAINEKKYIDRSMQPNLEEILQWQTQYPRENRRKREGKEDQKKKKKKKKKKNKRFFFFLPIHVVNSVL